MMRWTIAAALAAALSFALHPFPSVAGEAPPEPVAYRMEDYKSPVPKTLQGARVATTEQAAAILNGKQAIFIDVMPHLPKPAKLPAGTIWRDKVRMHIPGSVWLPNTGYGALSAEAHAYFRQALAAHTAGDKSRAILFYCMTDCWMSWNAAKRAVELGYAKVIWYPDGADGWEMRIGPLVEAKAYEAGS